MAEAFSTSLYARRHRSNAISKVLSFGATAFGLSWLVLILAVLLWKGFSGLSLAVFTQMTRRRAPRAACQSDRRQSRAHLPRRRSSARDRHAGRTYWWQRPLRQPLPGPLGRHPAQRPFDCHRPVHIRGHGRADGALFRMGRRRLARRDCHSGRGAYHRGHADFGAGHLARGGGFDRTAALDDHPHRLSRRARRHGHGRAAGDCPRQRRDRAGVFSPRSTTSSGAPPQCSGLQPAGRHLPVRAEPLQGLAGSRLDRRADHHARCARAQHLRAVLTAQRKTS